jgi:hypothetical protein
MNREDIIKLAREAGFALSDKATEESISHFHRFFNLATAAEREACAKVCDAHGFYGAAPAAEIRARGQA